MDVLCPSPQTYSTFSAGAEMTAKFSDDRDQIFGCLGLAGLHVDGFEQTITPDYRLGVNDVFITFFSLVLQYHPCLDATLLFAEYHDQAVNRGLPS